MLVGAGPGDPGLMTAAGSAWLARADVVLYDRLANPSLLAQCRDGAELIFVGKRPDAHALKQEQINELLVARTREGNLVVRLKGGDPFVFGRGGEEADALAEAGCEYRIVPGVTAAIAAGAYAGIPVTDRRAASCVTLVTGHEDPTKGSSSLNYEALAGVDTLVFYMGVKNLPLIAERLIAAGRSGRTPVALVHKATLPEQRTVTATLATAARAAEQAHIKPPTLLIVGEAVALRERIAWLEKLPLFGRTVLVTRTRRQASRLTRELGQLGAHVIESPAIEILPPDDWADVDAALRRLGEFDWLVLTSPNGADALIGRMRRLGMDGRALSGVRVAAVGPATGDVLRAAFVEPDLMPPKFTTRSLAEALVGEGLRSRKRPGEAARLLLARADIATDVLPGVLREAGAEAEELAVYRTVPPESLPEDALDALRGGRVDWVTFTSSSTVDNLLTLLGGSGVSLEGVKLASIGPITSETLEAHGLTPTVSADPHTIDGVVQAIVGFGEPNS